MEKSSSKFYFGPKEIKKYYDTKPVGFVSCFNLLYKNNVVKLRSWYFREGGLNEITVS